MATTTSLLALRRLVARRLGDYFGHGSGVDGPGTVTTGGASGFTDNARGEPVNYFNGAWLVTTAPTTIQNGRIATYAAGGVFTFVKALSSLSVADKYELYRLFSPAEYLAAINEAITVIGPTCRTENTPDESLTIVTNQTEYTIPSTFNTLYRVWVQDWSNTAVFWPLSKEDWDVRIGDSKLILDPSIVGLTGTTGGTTTSRVIKLEGEANVTGNLSAETDTTLAPRAYVVPAACAWLLEQVSQGKRDFQGREEHIERFLLAAQAAQAAMSPVTRHPNNRRVRQP